MEYKTLYSLWSCSKRCVWYRDQRLFKVCDIWIKDVQCVWYMDQRRSMCVTYGSKTFNVCDIWIKDFQCVWYMDVQVAGHITDLFLKKRLLVRVCAFMCVRTDYKGVCNVKKCAFYFASVIMYERVLEKVQASVIALASHVIFLFNITMLLPLKIMIQWERHK